jgi:hypothetical protein
MDRIRSRTSSLPQAEPPGASRAFFLQRDRERSLAATAPDDPVITRCDTGSATEDPINEADRGCGCIPSSAVDW